MKVINERHINEWSERWLKLSRDRFTNDHEIAKLANEVRSEFPDGASGDLQFCRFSRKHLKGCRASLLNDKAKAFNEFDSKMWVKLGGWPGVQFLLGLTRVQRYRVIETLKGPGPYHYSTIRDRAIRLGITTRRTVGRPTRSRSEEKVAVLRQFILELYRKRHNLPAIPETVKTAMSPTILSLISQDMRA